MVPELCIRVKVDDHPFCPRCQLTVGLEVLQLVGLVNEHDIRPQSLSDILLVESDELDEGAIREHVERPARHCLCIVPAEQPHDLDKILDHSDTHL
ncbi:MAG: hypothetical protein CMD31_00130 [Flavobacteriales bacterium]|nr:hypothetical protein [Flavobacteriales bacterium]